MRGMCKQINTFSSPATKLMRNEQEMKWEWNIINVFNTL